MEIDTLAATGLPEETTELSRFTDTDGAVMHRITFLAEGELSVGRDLRDVLHIIEAAADADEEVAKIVKARLSI